MKETEKNKFPKWLFVVLGIILLWIYGVQSSQPVSSLSATAKERRSIYAGPNVNYGVIGNLDANSVITLIGREGDTWVTFRFNGRQGWIQDIFLEIDGNSARLPEVEYVFIPTPTKRPQTTLIDSTLPCAVTSNLTGEQVKCKIVRAYCEYQPATSGSPTFCNDAPYPNHNFTLLVWGEDWSQFDGKCIIVSGVISTYQGKPQIEVFGSSQVSLCP